MTCEEFATGGLELGVAGEGGLLKQAAREHLRECPRCAALQENWQALSEDLRVLGAETAEAEAPSRVEMGLLQEFRTKHKIVRRRRAAFVAGWSFAAAAALFCAFLLVHWRLEKGAVVARKTGTSVQSVKALGNSGQLPVGITPGGAELGDVLVASSASGDFTLLPGSMPPAPEDATVVRVQMQRAALGALGLTVNEEHAGDWIQVDLLVGDDGLPQAVRLPQSNAETSN
jgi:predicted anti-sigma-YlaC factor YlaD